MTDEYDPGGTPAWSQEPWQPPDPAPDPASGVPDTWQQQAVPYWGAQSDIGVDPTDVVGRRVGAAIVDQIILLVPELVIFLGLMWQPLFGTGGLADQVGSATRSRSAAPPTLTGEFMSRYLLAIAAMWTVMFLYYFITERVLEGSPGKLMFGLRVVRGSGAAPISWGQSAGRNALRLLFDSSLIALIVILVSKGHRRVGDMAAHTLVIDKLYVGRFVELYPPSGTPPWEPFRPGQPYVTPPMPGTA